MKVSGFTFVRNVVKYDYPVVESIRSVLPVVDEFIVNVGRCDDGTLELIRSIGDPKIKIVESVWDETLRKDGLIYAQQTNIALAHCIGDWAFYIQADEVVHEDDLPAIQEAMRRHLGNHDVKGLLFRYLHFIVDYWSTNPWFYHKAVRIIRNNGEVESCGDAVGFHLKATEQYLQSGPKEWIAPSDGRVFHEKSPLDAPPGRAGRKKACCQRQHQSCKVGAWQFGVPATVSTTPAIIWCGLPSTASGYCKERCGSAYENYFWR